MSRHVEDSTRHKYGAFGPGEPVWCRRARNKYHARRRQTDRLEQRICMTDRGLEWLYRVKRAGLHPR